MLLCLVGLVFLSNVPECEPEVLEDGSFKAVGLNRVLRCHGLQMLHCKRSVQVALGNKCLLAIPSAGSSLSPASCSCYIVYHWMSMIEAKSPWSRRSVSLIVVRRSLEDWRRGFQDEDLTCGFFSTGFNNSCA